MEMQMQMEVQEAEDYTSSSLSSSSSSSSDERSGSEADESDGEETDQLALNDDDTDSTHSELPIVMPSTSGRTGRLAPSNLSKRLASFLPSLEQANQNLQRHQSGQNSQRRNLELEEGEDEPYIDMNLGLGVLEEKVDGDSDESESSDSSESSEDEDDLSREPAELSRPGGKRKSKDALDDMMGRKKRQKPSIKVVTEDEAGEMTE